MMIIDDLIIMIGFEYIYYEHNRAAPSTTSTELVQNFSKAVSFE